MTVRGLKYNSYTYRTASIMFRPLPCTNLQYRVMYRVETDDSVHRALYCTEYSNQ